MEREFHLPRGSVKLVLRKGRKVRADMQIGTFRERWRGKR
jgi:hypothetical protein